MQIYVIELGQDDPKKCTSRKMVHFGYANFTINPRGIILNPISSVVLSMDDKIIAEKQGITVIDSSWKKSDIKFYKKYYNKNSRRLPFLLAGNPTNYAKPFILSSLEAIAASLYILDMVELAIRILSLYKWGNTFYQLNLDILESYRGKSRQEIEKIEKEYMGEPQ
ncbi:DUF367 family protein [Acidianus sulfidivorans JP7]|uniref:16S rRNA aminocarboxypropyltransferase n=1 Tax=Acidianus sulfidivorans JP7 TaxID=619593 RepID=A0A2U9IMI8_9CREN|nr:DUF367 family protein [Acidianus sulfidivorans]AWR97230.1 DUF367 family protein [Acidianus sulfidivorans JP7]